MCPFAFTRVRPLQNEARIILYLVKHLIRCPRRPHRLTVRTSPSQGGNQSSILCGVTKARVQKDWTVPVFFAFVKAERCELNRVNRALGTEKFLSDGKEITVAHLSRNCSLIWE
jgi:hypothetical protein